MTGPASVKPSRKSAKPTDDDSFDSGSGQSESEYKGSDGDDYADEDEDESPRVASSSELVITNGRATKVEKVGGRPKNYGCPFDGCSKSYTRPVRLEEHVRSHTGERPFVCDVCEATFLRASHLRAHARSHMDETKKPSQCEECDKRFWTNQHLRKHVETMHKGKTYDCQVCSEKFRKHNHLRVHLAEAHCPPGTHPFPCAHPGCDKTFKQNHQLKTHQRTHDLSRYQCAHPDCVPLPLEERAFGNWTALQRHTNQAHPPTCPRPECNGQTFTSRRGLKLHMEIHGRKDAVAAEGDKALETDGGYTTDGGRGKKRRRGRGAGRKKKPRQCGAGAGDETEADVQVESDQEEGSSKKKAKTGDDALPWKCTVQDGCTKAFKSRDALLSHIERKHAKKLAQLSPSGLAFLDPLPSIPIPSSPKPAQPVFTEGPGFASTLALDFPTLAPAGPSPFAPLSALPAIDLIHSDPPAQPNWGSSSLLDLLTGNDYAPLVVPTLGDLSGSTDAGRKYRCPFPGVLAIAEPVAEGEWDGGNESEEVEALGRECRWRFKRAYDVERHLKSMHGCRVEPDKLEDWLEEERKEEEAVARVQVGA